MDIAAAIIAGSFVVIALSLMVMAAVLAAKEVFNYRHHFQYDEPRKR